jgi:hypothetical protein
MRGSFPEQYAELFAMKYGAESAMQLDVDIPRALMAQMPKAWVEMVRAPGPEAVRALWAPAKGTLSRFVEELCRSIEGAAIVEQHGAVALVLALRDWEEEWRPEWTQRHPGFCWMGLPTERRALTRFIDEVGALPASLEGLWSVTSFMNTRHGSMICSLRSADSQWAGAPERIAGVSRSNPSAEPFECLKIAEVNGQMVTCMLRPPGQPHWDDVLADRFHVTGEIWYCVRSPLDNMLANFTEADQP